MLKLEKKSFKTPKRPVKLEQKKALARKFPSCLVWKTTTTQQSHLETSFKLSVQTRIAKSQNYQTKITYLEKSAKFSSLA